MGFIANLFRRADEFARLDRELLLSQEQSKKLEFQVSALEKEVKSERRKYDKLVYQTLNTVNKQNGLPMLFKEEALPVEKVDPKLDSATEDAINKLAYEMLQQDENDGITPMPIDDYKVMIRQDPDRYADVIPTQ